MPFRLKEHMRNIQKMTNKIFKAKINKTLKVYMDNMILKSSKKEKHGEYLAIIFIQIHQYNMRLNPK